MKERKEEIRPEENRCLEELQSKMEIDNNLNFTIYGGTEIK